MDNMQLWLSSSTDSINLNDSAEGFYLNPDLEGLTGLPEIRSVNGLNAGYDGGWTATQLWAARLITIRGVIAINDKAAVETKRKALAKILSQGKNEDLELKFVSEAGNTYTTTVRTSYCTMALQRVFWRQEYQIQLRANDPLIYDDGGSELIAILRVMAGEGGFEIPFDIPFDIGGSITPTSIDVGDEATYPLIRLKGDLHNPTIINMTTNQRMQVLADIITTIEWRDYTTAYTTNGFAQISNGIDGAPLSLTHLYGNATQKTLSGKNKENYLDAVPATAQTTTTFIANGFRSETTSTGYATKLAITGLKPSTTYTATWTLKIVSGTINPRITCFKGSGQQSGNHFMVNQTVDGTRHSTFTTDAGETEINIWYYNGSNAAGITEWTFLQLEEGSFSTDYEQFVGGTPSPNPSYPQDVNVVTGGQTVKITGKNLMYNHATSGSSQGISYTVQPNGDVDISAGTATATSSFLPQSAYQSMELPAGTWTFSTSAMTSVGQIRLETYAPSDLSTRIGLKDGDTGSTHATITTTQVTKMKISIIMARNGQSVPNMTIGNFMLEKSATPTSYEPYQGQTYEINLGKNLVEEIIPGTNIDSSGKIVSYVDYQIGIAKVEQGKTYVLTASGQAVYGFFTTKPVLGSVSYDGQRTATNTMYFTAPISGYIAFRSSNGYATQQCELGTTPTSYVAYKTPLELAKIGNYTDGIKQVGDKWYIHKEIGKVIWDGSESWTTASDYCYHTESGAYVPESRNVVADILCDNFTPNTYTLATSATLDYAIALDSNNVGRFALRHKDYLSASTLKTWLSTHNTTVYYALATPTDTEITDSELIEQLNHIYSLYGGVNNIMLIPSAGAQGEMEVSYATTEDIDYHEVVIDCQARTVTQDGHNLYPALADGSEFIRLVPGENKLYLTSEVESDDGTAEVKFKKGNISI